MNARHLLQRSTLSTAVLLAMTPPAFAIDYFFSNGFYVPGVTAPEPLLFGDVLQINAGGNKFFSGSTLTNQAGTVNWNADTLYLQSGALIDNRSLWDAKSDDALVNNGGATSTFNNSGTFRKSGGLGNTTIGTIAFVNSGVIDAQTGTILFSGGNATFNAGSQFIGAGSTVIGANANFNGAFSASNLSLSAGSFTGTAAQINGSVAFSGGSFAGTWEVASGQSLVGGAGGNKFISGASLANNGSFVWQTGDTLYLQNGATFTNNALHDIQASSSIVNNGGALSTYTNGKTGTLKVAAGQSAGIGTIAFVNDGGTLTANGTLNFGGGNATFNNGTLFNGSGSSRITGNASFNGTTTSGNLVLQAGTFTGGTAAALSGSTDFSGGYFAGTWQLASGQVLNGKDGGNKFMNGVAFTNLGTLRWQTGETLYMQNGANFANNALHDIQASSSIVNNGGPLSTYTNGGTGTLRVAAGQTANLGTIAFVNDGGTLQAEGTLNFGGGNATFNAGTLFTGGGVNLVTANARFVDGFNSQNLRLASGSFSGGDGGAASRATVSGTVEFTGGYFDGNWQVAAGQTVVGLGGGNKFLNGVQFTNNGNLLWRTGDALYMQNGASVDNQQLFDVQESMALVNNGGPLSTFTNSNLMKVSTGKTANVGGVHFVNNGTLDAAGTFNFGGGDATFNDGGQFTGAGVTMVTGNATFNGTQVSTNLSLRSGAFTGSGAVVHGTVEFSGGYLQGDWEVAAGHTLAGRDGGNKFLNGVSLANHGTFAWQSGNTLYLQNGALLDNAGLFDMQSGAAIVNNGGALSTFANSGTLRVAAGQSGVVGAVAFINNAGTVDVGAGASLNFAGGNANFNDGTRFTGSGVSMVTANAAFGGNFDSTNLSLRSGSFTGSGAVLKSGSADFSGGYLQGDWTVAAGATLNGVAGGTKFINGATLTNQGTLAWKVGDTLYFQNAGHLLNQGTIDLQADSAMVFNGGAVGTFVNTGLIAKTAGSGTSTIGNALGFDNQGVVDVQIGTIRLPDNFTNNGTLQGVGAFTTNLLTNAGHVAPGSSPGTLTLNGNYAQTAAGFLDTELASGALFDVFLVNGTAALDGTLALSCVLTCALNDGDVFVILDATGKLTGTFANVTLLNFGSGFEYEVIYDRSADLVKLQVIHAGVVPEPETWALMLAGLGFVGALVRRRRGRGRD